MYQANNVATLRMDKKLQSDWSLHVPKGKDVCDKKFHSGHRTFFRWAERERRSGHETRLVVGDQPVNSSASLP